MHKIIISFVILATLATSQFASVSIQLKEIKKDVQDLTQKEYRRAECIKMFNKLSGMSTEKTIGRMQIEERYFNFTCIDFIENEIN